MKFVIFKDPEDSGKWRWSFQAANGKYIFGAHALFVSPSKAKRSIASLPFAKGIPVEVER